MITQVQTEQTMHAVAQDRYGSPDVMTLADVPQPTPGPGQVLLRIEAAALNARDRHVMRGEPRLARLHRQQHPRAPPPPRGRSPH